MQVEGGGYKNWVNSFRWVGVELGGLRLWD